MNGRPADRAPSAVTGAGATVGASQVSAPSLSEPTAPLGPGARYRLRYSVRAIGHSFSARYTSRLRTNTVTGSSSIKPVSLPLSQWSYQRRCSSCISRELKMAISSPSKSPWQRSSFLGVFAIS